MNEFYVRRCVTPRCFINLDSGLIPTSVDVAHKMILSQVLPQGGYGVAWKLGGTTAETRRVFRVDGVYFGVLHQDEVFTLPRTAPNFPLVEIKGEVEIALRISPELDRLIEDGVDITSFDPKGLFDRWYWALEMPASPVVDLIHYGISALIADRCAAGALILGAGAPFDETMDSHWSEGHLRLCQDGICIAEGDVSSLLAKPEICARDFLVDALARGYSPRAGQWISTGGLTPCVPLCVGGKVQLFCNETSVLDFEISVAS